jgi:hypothetical protein
MALSFATMPFAVAGTGCVVAGGLVAAATAAAPSAHASWAVAYLVLVAGVAQVGLGLGQGALASRAPSGRRLALETGAWNVGNAAVLAGVLVGVGPLVDLGGALLVIALVLLVHAVRDGGRHDTRIARWTLYGFRLLVLILLVSIPVGLVLARTWPA